MDIGRDTVAVVTGAAGGIGYGLAEALARAGASVVLADVDEAALRAAAERVAALGVDTLPVRTDVSREADVRDLAEAATARFGAVAAAAGAGAAAEGAAGMEGLEALTALAGAAEGGDGMVSFEMSLDLTDAYNRAVGEVYNRFLSNGNAEQSVPYRFRIFGNGYWERAM